MKKSELLTRLETLKFIAEEQIQENDYIIPTQIIDFLLDYLGDEDLKKTIDGIPW